MVSLFTLKIGLRPNKGHVFVRNKSQWNEHRFRRRRKKKHVGKCASKPPTKQKKKLGWTDLLPIPGLFYFILMHWNRSTSTTYLCFVSLSSFIGLKVFFWFVCFIAFFFLLLFSYTKIHFLLSNLFLLCLSIELVSQQALLPKTSNFRQ